MSQQVEEPFDSRRDAVYSQDCDFYRHQDELMWGRFQTAATIEGGLLGVLYALPAPGLGADKRYFVLGAFLLVLILSLLSLKDWYDGTRHRTRIIAFERPWPFPKSRWPAPLSGFLLMSYAIVLLNVVNMVLLWRHW